MNKLFRLARRIVIKLKRNLGKKYSDSDMDIIFSQDIAKLPQVVSVTGLPGELKIDLESGGSLYARRSPRSDSQVFLQVYSADEYGPAVELFRMNFPAKSPVRIIDAGANVGYSSRYFCHAFTDLQIACVEPVESNMQMVKKNLAEQISQGKVIPMMNALLNESGKNILIRDDFRDGKDWSKTVEETDEPASLQSISVEDVLKRLKWTEVDILKIDIEGAERFLFGEETAPAFLDRTRVIAVEIHDEFNVRDKINHQLKHSGFILFSVDQTTFGINTRLARLAG